MKTIKQKIVLLSHPFLIPNDKLQIMFECKPISELKQRSQNRNKLNVQQNQWESGAGLK